MPPVRGGGRGLRRDSLVRTDAGCPLPAVAVEAKDLESGWASVLLEPAVEGCPAGKTILAFMSVAPTVFMIHCKEFNDGLPTTFTHGRISIPFQDSFFEPAAVVDGLLELLGDVGHPSPIAGRGYSLFRMSVVPGLMCLPVALFALVGKAAFITLSPREVLSVEGLGCATRVAGSIHTVQRLTRVLERLFIVAHCHESSTFRNSVVCEFRVAESDLGSDGRRVPALFVRQTGSDAKGLPVCELDDEGS